MVDLVGRVDRRILALRWKDQKKAVYSKAKAVTTLAFALNFQKRNLLNERKCYLLFWVSEKRSDQIINTGKVLRES